MYLVRLWRIGDSRTMGGIFGGGGHTSSKTNADTNVTVNPNTEVNVNMNLDKLAGAIKEVGKQKAVIASNANKLNASIADKNLIMQKDKLKQTLKINEQKAKLQTTALQNKSHRTQLLQKDFKDVFLVSGIGIGTFALIKILKKGKK